MTTFTKNLNIHLQILRKQKKLIEKKVDNFADKIIKTILNNGKIFIIGNGGSAADAQHFATELMVRMRKNRIALPVLALTTDTSAITAIGNDYNFDKIFSRQLEALGSNRDLLVAISTSGNSKNIIEAIKLSKKNHRFLYTASSRLFEGYKNKRVNEKTPFNYNTYYSLSKDLGLKIVEFYKKNFYLHLSSVILFTIYSKYSDQNFLLPKVINQIKNNQKINVKNANFKIDFIDGQSAVFLLHKIINKKKADNFIISSGTKFLFSKIIKELAIFLNKNTEMINVKISKKIFCKNNYGSNEKILKALRLRKNYFTLKYIIKNIL
jgi:D-sedoheptulose 7-phosphate isomerase